MRLAAAVLLAAALAGCGYRVGGKADLVPANVKTIAIPAFANTTSRYKLTESLPNAIGREFISRTKYRIVAEPEAADAILKGAVVNFFTAPTIFDQRTGRAAGIQIMVYMNLTLVEKGTGKVLYQRDNLEIRGRYEVATDQEQYFDESGVALQRLSQEIARQVVSSILEAF